MSGSNLPGAPRAAPPTTDPALDLVADFYRWTQEAGSHGSDCPYGRDATVKERKEKGCTCGLWDLEKRADALLNGPAADPFPAPAAPAEGATAQRFCGRVGGPVTPDDRGRCPECGDEEGHAPRARARPGLSRLLDAVVYAARKQPYMDLANRKALAAARDAVLTVHGELVSAAAVHAHGMGQEDGLARAASAPAADPDPDFALKIARFEHAARWVGVSKDGTPDEADALDLEAEARSDLVSAWEAMRATTKAASDRADAEWSRANAAPAPAADPGFEALVDALVGAAREEYRWAFSGSGQGRAELKAARSALVSAWEALRAERDRWQTQAMVRYTKADAQIAAAEARAEVAERERDAEHRIVVETRRLCSAARSEAEGLRANALEIIEDLDRVKRLAGARESVEGTVNDMQARLRAALAGRDARATPGTCGAEFDHPTKPGERLRCTRERGHPPSAPGYPGHWAAP